MVAIELLLACVRWRHYITNFLKKEEEILPELALVKLWRIWYNYCVFIRKGE
jgi:hypothetical protein